eukprot:10177790-Alexandrium_andersonii.AAC.1
MSTAQRRQCEQLFTLPPLRRCRGFHEQRDHHDCRAFAKDACVTALPAHVHLRRSIGLLECTCEGRAVTHR